MEIHWDCLTSLREEKSKLMPRPDRGELLQKHPRRRRRHDRTAGLVLSCLLLMFVFALFSRAVEMMRAQQELAHLQAEVAAYELRKSVLQTHIRLLQDDAHIERVAREELGLVSPGEIQYLPVQVRRNP